MKKLLAVVLLSLGLCGVAIADTRTQTVEETLIALKEVPGKVAGHISAEIERTNEFQKKQWNDLKSKFSAD